MSIKILATGLGWLGNGVESITTNTEQLLLNARYEICIAAYNISSGALEFLEQINTPLSRGVDVRILVNKYKNHHPRVINFFEGLSKRYGTVSIYDYIQQDGYDLHAKMVIVDRECAIIGSSNMSRRGLFENHELAVMITGDEVEKVQGAFDLLCTNKYTTRKVDL
ncbi:phospholipase D-like domain-containing protein [Paenibacillus alvei]|uniref:PLD phosphodiesterase domain-containing protein n=1 Tax=Paenibacillus alvei TaxID=44250 RepID=A0AAP7A619_PAEAL|nr:phospholipase D-like domain-containing protein [Paenibacillus alvei]NOJ73981.1 hypothetical protein [Paenibacillus alvei]